jgi:hypothetical protein
MVLPIDRRLAKYAVRVAIAMIAAARIDTFAEAHAGMKTLNGSRLPVTFDKLVLTA